MQQQLHNLVMLRSGRAGQALTGCILVGRQVGCCIRCCFSQICKYAARSLYISKLSMPSTPQAGCLQECPKVVIQAVLQLALQTLHNRLPVVSHLYHGIRSPAAGCCQLQYPQQARLRSRKFAGHVLSAQHVHVTTAYMKG